MRSLASLLQLPPEGASAEALMSHLERLDEAIAELLEAAAAIEELLN